MIAMPCVAQGKSLCQIYLLCLLTLFLSPVTSKVFELRCFKDKRREVLLDIDFTLRITASTRYGPLLGDQVVEMIKTTEVMHADDGICGRNMLQIRLLFGNSYFTIEFKRDDGVGSPVVTFIPELKISGADVFPWIGSTEIYRFTGPKGMIPNLELFYKCLRNERQHYTSQQWIQRSGPFIVQVDIRSIRFKAFGAASDEFPHVYSCGAPRNYGAIVAASVMFALLFIAIVGVVGFVLRQRFSLVGSPIEGERDSESVQPDIMSL